MHPAAHRAYVRAFRDSGLAPFRIVQTATGAIGRRVVASAGTHDSDGFLSIEGESYAAAVDLSVWRVRGVTRWDEARIKWALYNLADEGFAAWYRYRDSFKENRHIHAVYCGVQMKSQCQMQVIDFLNDRTGLQGHAAEPFWTAPQSVDLRIERLFLLHNPEAAKWL
jgi:hypothetical protein